ncbi:FKBP-type peptidyl-prolyl cis-trans isomerase [Streptomyces sp. WAC05374]|uniref:FKBP-type peptidyl-prolyl cis-trans isomerase n=1 Tax=Streptomyces sp. WAC05374 TaxID=2487420 RepID=UPI000F8797C0|nr:FKBP-type peptidyl-prolyl cis-trans isomerase [Streptomyces sp. WAC05374]RST17610.1 FKBP-type peptidyl-prolyl cis-trans isomerase [Streptomyces sp. WAC05374]TDF36753.1 FKBP-type peptidyl-prolyl cis-trans isomerase [Streptomyces sp. WAC05374]TDF45819.1 FKBP-type peptidyl-prolyl cis-trans isomerase [Streptomyces sp. WAC05374]TDF51485.1 FKBP-type peptidyl-prolyl cis-trans isomerase [Streptomyces sp. WAC05374]
MRRRSLLLAVPAGLLTLAGCGDDKADQAKTDESPSTSQEPSAKIVDGPLPAITAGTAFGQKPTVAKGPGKPSPNLAVKTVVAGKGETVAKGDFLQFDYLGQIWDTAKVFDNSYDRGAPLTSRIGVGQLIPGWDQALPGKKVGSRVELAIPPALGYGTQGNPQGGIKGTDTLVFVVDIRGTFNGKSSAKGREVAQDNIDLPKVGTNTDGKAPSIDVPKKPAPKKLVSKYVLEGDGPAVKPTDKLLLQYKGVLWEGGKEFDASYKRGELAEFPLQSLIQGWQQGLKGKKVGSRVMLVVPPELGYGAQASGDIPANSTLVFSLDILAVM